MTVDVGIVAQRENPRAAELAASIRSALVDADVGVHIDDATAADLGIAGRAVEAMDACDLVVSIGGDGTFLFTARGAGDTPVMGVNLGEVGFLNVVPPEECVEAVTEEVARIRETGTPQLQEMPRVQARGDGWELPPALNEVAIIGEQRGHGQGIGVEVRIDGSLYTGGHADGVLVATPTGSTAYNLSEGGPLVHPSVAGFVVTEMVADGPMPPLVVSPEAEITVRVADAERAYVVGDGRTKQAITPPTQVDITRADHPVRVAGPPLEFFAALGKLN
jgi:NAD+ kinase